MMGSRRCEYCYCISGARKCIRPKCLLPLPGCTPLYAPHSCCPVAYNCTRECSLHSPRIQIITHTAFSSSLFFKISIRRRWRRSRETVSETLHLFPPFFFSSFFLHGRSRVKKRYVRISEVSKAIAITNYSLNQTEYATIIFTPTIFGRF